MMEFNSPRSWPWLLLSVLGGLWGLVIYQLGPQWSIFPQYNYAWAVPVLCLYVAWERWKTRPQPNSPRMSVWPGLIIGTCAFILLPTRLIQEANTVWRVASWAMALSAVGITLSAVYLAGGRKWLKHFCFPICFFLVAVPWPSQIEQAVVQNLTRANVATTVETLAVKGIPAMKEGNVIEISTGRVGVDEACSGVRSFQATLMISLFLGELYRFGFLRRIGLIAAGAGLAFVFNAARTFLLVFVAARDGISAVAKWHDPAGVTILVACFCGLWGLALWLRAKSIPADASPVVDRKMAAHPVPRGLMLGLAAWLTITEASTELWYRVHESASTEKPEWSMHWPKNKNLFKDIKISERVRGQLNYDEGRSASWTETDGSHWQLYYFRWQPGRTLAQRVKVQSAKSHRPEVCLPATGMILREDLGVKQFEVGGLKLPFRSYFFEDRTLPLHVYFCVWEEGKRSNSLANMREDFFARVAAVCAGNRGLGQRVLEIAVWGIPEQREADAALSRGLLELIRE